MDTFTATIMSLEPKLPGIRRGPWRDPAAGGPSWRMVGLLFYLVVALPGYALDPAKNLDQFNCQTWSRRDRLPAGSVNAIAQTPDGYLWLGTEKGLVRFDGLEFNLIPPPDQPPFLSWDISSLASSKAGGLWFGINAGAPGYYDGRRFAPITNVGWLNQSSEVRSIREAGDGAVWVAGQTVAGGWVPGATNEMSFGGDFRGGISLGLGLQGRIWVGTRRNGLYSWQTGKISRFPDAEVNQSIVYAVQEDAAGQLWVGTENGLRSFDAGFHRREIGDWHGEVRSLLVDRRGVVWIGTAGGGLWCYKNGRYAAFTKADGLADDFVTALFEDREGSLWVGTRDGLSQIADVELPVYSSAEGLPGGSYHAVAASSGGGLWVATSDGFSHFDGRRATNYTAVEGWSDPNILRIFEAKDGDVYLITGTKQIAVFSGGRIVASYANRETPGAFAEDARGVLVSVSSNLFRVSRSQLVPYAFQDGQTPPFQWIHNMTTGRDGALWIASINGIFRVRDGRYRHWSIPEGLSWDKVHCVCEDADGTVWAGLLTGIARLKDDQIRNISHANGLFDDFIFALVPDDLGGFWVNSKRGIFRVSRQSLNDFCDGKTNQVQCETFYGSEMAATVSTTDQAWIACKTKDGRIWFPSPRGVVMVNPANPHINPVPPLVQIREVRANGRLLAGNQLTAIPHGRGDLEFQFSALSFIAPAQVQFRYQLDGYDHGWQAAGTNRVAVYANVKPGKYAFRVLAGNNDGVWSDPGAVVDLELPPHWYQTLWFYLGGLALVAAAALKLFAWRVDRMRRRQHELEAARQLLELRVRERTMELEARTQQLEREIEERRQLEKQLLQAQKMEAVGQLSAGIAHDFNNLLMVINGNASLLLMCGPRDASEITEYAEQIVEAAERAASLTRQLLMFSRKQVIRPTPLDLNDVAANMTKLLQRLLGEDVALTSHYADRLPVILADAGMMEQILLNLAVNSRDAMPRGGRLTIATEAVRLEAEPAGPNAGTPAGAYVGLTVTDTGGGIAPENLAHIFEPFFTTKEAGKGTGLGLATVYGIVKQHQGRITVQSTVGKGTTFRLYFPVLAGAAPAKPAGPAATTLPRGTETILVVEDELIVRLSVGNMLQRFGYTVYTAASGVEALKVWREHRGEIQLLLTDIVMPDGVGGFELAGQLQAEMPGLKIIYTSGYSGDLADKRLTLVEGVNFLQKPYAPQILAAALRKNLDRNGA